MEALALIVHLPADSHGHAGAYAPPPLLPFSKTAALACAWHEWRSSGLASGCAMPVLQGQVSRDDVAALCVELLEQPAASNTTFEVCSSGSAGEQQDLKVHSSATQT